MFENGVATARLDGDFDPSLGSHRHFDQIASVYEDLHDTTLGVIDAVVRHLPRKDRPLRIADVGCGTGRYSFPLAERVHPASRFYLMDHCGKMLLECRKRAAPDGDLNRFLCCRVDANMLPLAERSLDAIVTFNAIHHLDLNRFLVEVGRVLREDGLLVIYTRTQEQNARTVWGRHFPGFKRRETRLFKGGQLERAIDLMDKLCMERTDELYQMREEPPESLVEKARRRHYSTFALYPPEELARALTRFAQRLKAIGRSGSVVHLAENTILFARRC
jgi:ubiquinone/menaquinone biosynthesis C-methylase UbiE